MGITFDWDNTDQTVMRYTVSGQWNWNDFHKHLRRSLLWLDTVDHTVEAIIDFRGTTRFPAGAFGHLRSLGKAIHVNASPRVVLIGVESALKQQIGGDDGIYHDGQRTIRFADSDDEAAAIIAGWVSENE